MGGYGYSYQSFTTFTTTGSRTNEEAFGSFTRRPLFPNSDDYDCAPRNTLVPVANYRPHNDDYKHGSPTKAYPVRYEDDWHRQSSPVHVHDRPQKGDELLTKRTMVPVATRPYGGDGYKYGSPTKVYHACGDDEWHRPHRDDELLTKRTGVPVATRPFGVDEFNKPKSPVKAYPARDDDKPHDLLTKRTMAPVATRPIGREYKRRSPTKSYDAGGYDEWHRRRRDDELFTKKTGVPVATGPFGVDEYNKHGSPVKAYPARDDDKPHDLLTKRTTVPVATRPNDREYERGSPTTQKPQASPPVIWTDWRRSPRSTASNGKEEEPRAIDKPIVSQDRSSFPRNGTQPSEATDDIDKVAGLFIQAARLALASEGDYKAPKPTANNAFPTPNDNGSHSRERRNLGANRPNPTPSSDSLIDASRRSVTIDSREAEKKYNGKRV